MPAKGSCLICQHPSRAEIDSALLKPGASTRAVAIAFALTYSTTYLHRSKCLLPATRKVLKRLEKVTDRTIVHDLVDVKARLKASIDSCQTPRDLATVAQVFKGYAEIDLKLGQYPGFREIAPTQVNIDARESRVLMLPSLPSAPSLPPAPSDDTDKQDE